MSDDFRNHTSSRTPPKFRINFTAEGQGTEVYIDEKRLTQLKSVKVGAAVDCLTTVELEFVAVEVEASGDGEIVESRKPIIDISDLESAARTYEMLKRYD